MSDHEELTNRFLRYLAAELGLSQNTIRSYGLDLKRFGEIFPQGVHRTTRDELRRSLAEIQETGLAPATVSRKISTLRHYFFWLRRKRLMVGDPLINIAPPKRPMRLPKPVNDSDFRKMLTGCVRQASIKPRGRWGYAPGMERQLALRDRAILQTLDSCGLRVSEICGLAVEDLHLDEGYLIVRAGKGDKDRFVPIDAGGAKVLRRYMEHAWPVFYAQEKLVFPMTRQRVWQILRMACERGGVSQKHPHQLRHRFGSKLVRGGAELQDVADLMGHVSTDTTLGYTAIDLEYMREKFRETHPRAKKRQ